ncbi:nucleotidyltransferase domain-containing protein [Staphylococcus simiae]|uniref:nucleotidyltransferase domain-containing protein n=1 Tax=Staphylococcus simiae TaxID=308354 RepID=UPI001A96B73C|nr:nucleotidyltransferase domain-containing protein [Staphylococcus simiae]MBO1200575.1 nucleotidyltransferase domain-containing protein [Staphylococcus simiae]MBO1202846.1 nucleotidyltransferase domain-containing protein [Staphylococcus simiae]MBO1210373.1 nucleotidyltransferase domain-containing protein [Staphylococcus simiae]MBO1228912.1 nucleotidyltransferase domain-containing protein [Staphylococcus simiae]
MYTALNNDTLKNLKNEMNIYETFIKVYVFGSFLNDQVYSNDIDILIIYRKYSQEFTKDLDKFKTELTQLINLPLDLNALSEKEENDIKFIKRLNNNYFVLK